MYNTDDYKGTICTIILILLISRRRAVNRAYRFSHFDRFHTWINKISSQISKNSENDIK